MVEKIREVMRMIYLSKGVVQERSTEQLLYISRCGQSFQLTGVEATLWLNGRFEFATAKGTVQEQALQRLNRIGLAECEQENTAVSRYRILTRCVCCPTVFSKGENNLSNDEKIIIYWLSNAGIRLSVAELIYLNENHIEPTAQLLYKENHQVLIELIYTRNTIADNILENMMETASSRDEVIRILQKLLKKKQILLL